MATRHFGDDINARLTTEARLSLQTRIDLDAFLALDTLTRAAHWRGWDRQAKADAVVQMLVRIWTQRWGAEDAGQAWDQALVEQWIAHYDMLWGVELTAGERAVAGALELLADQAARQERHAAIEEERALAAGEAQHVAHAQREFIGGRRAQEVERGVWSVPSATQADVAYHIHLSSRTCSCPEGHQGCWHLWLALAAEAAPELIHDPAPTIFAPAPEPVQPPSTGTPLPVDASTADSVPPELDEGGTPRADRRVRRWAA